MSTFVNQFEEAKRIHGFCPCCGELFRLSDVHIFTKTPPPRTPFDRAEDDRARLEDRIERFEAKELEIRANAKIRGQREAKRHLKKIAPYFFGPSADLSEVKLLFDPVEYIVFKGLRRSNCSAIEFVDHPPETKDREHIQHSLTSAIHAGNIEWQTYRVGNSGRVTTDATHRPAKAVVPKPPSPTPSIPGVPRRITPQNYPPAA